MLELERNFYHKSNTSVYVNGIRFFYTFITGLASLAKSFVGKRYLNESCNIVSRTINTYIV